MTPTPPMTQLSADTVNETTSSSSASSQYQSEPNEETKPKTQVSSTNSSVTALNSELTTLTAINQGDKGSILFSSSSSASSDSSKSVSSSILNQSNENKLDGQIVDSNNNRNLDQKVFRKQTDTFKSNTQNKVSNLPRVNYQKSNRYFQTEPLTIQTSNSRSQSQMSSPFYYGNHSNPISPIKNSRQNLKQSLPRNLKNSEMLKINTNMNASNYVGSVISAMYPDAKSSGPFSCGSKNYNLNSQSQSSVSNAAETIANFANQAASVNSSIIPNTSRPNSYPNEFKPNQPSVQPPQQFIYPNFYYYTNPAALPINQNAIFGIEPNMQRSNQMNSSATPHSFNPYYQTQTSSGSNSDSQKQNSNASSTQSTILNAFETATNNPNPILNEQLDEMMQKSLNISQYESQQYTGPFYYLAQIPNSQFYAYYYAPSGTILGPSPAQSQMQIIAPVQNQNSSNPQMNQPYQNQQNFAPQQFMSQMYMQHQMIGQPCVQSNSQSMPFLQLPTVSYLNSGQQNLLPQNSQQMQYQHATQASPKQNFPNMYQYGSAITPKGASIMSSSSSQNRPMQTNPKSNYKHSGPID